MRALVTGGCAEIRRSASAPGVFGGQRVVAASWGSFALAASEAHGRAFRDRASDGDPRLGVETLLAGNEALVAAAISPQAGAAATQADALWDSLARDMLCVATVDEAQPSAWSAAVATGSPATVAPDEPPGSACATAAVARVLPGRSDRRGVGDGPRRARSRVRPARPGAGLLSPRARPARDHAARLAPGAGTTRLLTAPAEAGSSAPRVVSGFPSPKPTVS